MTIEQAKANELIDEFRRNNKGLPPYMTKKAASKHVKTASKQIIEGHKKEIQFWEGVVKCLKN